ncbi:MAG: AAA family ATPase [Planctomycetaceae bacterium]|nr:AAA family ATPase [Planctomycetaceae bacterium]
MAKQVAPENVVGRDKLIGRIWKAIDQGSVVFTAERRIGKTTVLKKMQAESPPNKVVLYADLEKVDSPTRFVEVVLTDLKNYQSKKAAIGRWLGGLVESIGGTEIGGVIKIPPQQKKGWQSILEKILTDTCNHQTNQQIVFLWDEVPYMLQKIDALEEKSGSTDNSSLAILDSLRAMRNENDNLRMIFTGSVGLHHVLRDLRGQDYASQPTNDMEKVEIGPLALEDAATLARNLLGQEAVTCDSQEPVIAKIVELTDAVPFYIHRVVTRMTLLESTVTPKDVEVLVQRQLVDDSDPWEMEHFRERLKIYYRHNLPDADGNSIPAASLAGVLLDFLALAPSPRSIDQCYADLRSKVRIDNRDDVVQLLKSLAQDHYLVRDEKGRYRFRFPLVQRWWRTAQGLEGTKK